MKRTESLESEFQTFKEIGAWTLAAKDWGLIPQKDPFRLHTFIALDYNNQLCGTFVVNPVFYHGILFKTRQDFLIYMNQM